MQIFMPERAMFTRWVLVFVNLCLVTPALAIEIDFSRRQSDLERFPVSTKGRQPASEKAKMQQVVAATAVPSDIVILNTKNGFVPSSVNLQVGRRYRIHVVNIIKEKKNVSFVMPLYKQNHSTYFGEQRTFSLEPKADGIFTFECPETASEGRIVVLPMIKRGLASELVEEMRNQPVSRKSNE